MLAGHWMGRGRNGEHDSCNLSENEWGEDMFEDSLLEYGGRSKTKKGWTVAFSFAFQTIIIGVMVLIPLIYTEALPRAQLMTFLMAPPPPPPPPPPPAPTR